jgi:hypothetical protein
MPRQELTITQLAPRGLRAGTVGIQNTPDAVNFNYWRPTGADIVVVRNPTGAAATIKFSQTPDQAGAMQGVAAWTRTVPPNSLRAWGIFRPSGFIQADGRIYVDASVNTIRIIVLALNRP